MYTILSLHLKRFKSLPSISSKLWIIAVCAMICAAQADNHISGHVVRMNGHALTIEDVVSVARDNAFVSVDPHAMQIVKRSHELLLLVAAKNMPVYGLNRGVGLNKDKTIFAGNVLTPEARKESEQFNLNDIFATSAGVGPIASREVVRAAMVARLNTLLLGHAGAQPAVIQMFVDFLNHDITPLFPSGGSIGEADITILAHIGLAMTGRGDVLYHGQRMPALAAMQKAHLAPLHLYAKDALSIFSSNAFTAGMAALDVYDVERLLNKYDLLVALSLEGINGNIAPFLEPVRMIRPYSGQNIAAANVMRNLEGSYLLQVSDKRALQDPLSFRTASQVSGAARETLATLRNDLTIQLNSSDDNPAVILDVKPLQTASTQERSYFVDDGKLYGAIIPTANFEPIAWVLDIEKMNIALGHMSASSTQRIVKLGSFCVNQLSRFLSPDQATIAFAAIQKPIMYLNTDIQQQSIPVSTISYPVAGDIEDTATNSLLVVQHFDKIIEDLYQIMGFELLHASQALDLKKIQTPSLPFGKATTKLFVDYRKSVLFLQKDRELTPDIKKSYEFIRGYNVP